MLIGELNYILLLNCKLTLLKYVINSVKCEGWEVCAIGSRLYEFCMEFLSELFRFLYG
jgi:hypothetical protein